jgi:hypothetical protein
MDNDQIDDIYLNLILHPNKSASGNKPNLPHTPVPPLIMQQADRIKKGLMSAQDRYKDLVRKAYHET